MARQVHCPICNNAIEWSEKSPFRPFCSERCKLTDLGAWASDAYRVAAQEESPGDAPDVPGDPSGPQRTTH